MEIGNVTKAATFKSFLHQSYKNTQLLFLWQCFLIIFIRQTLTVDFWGLHKNKNCSFPLINLNPLALGIILLVGTFSKFSKKLTYLTPCGIRVYVQFFRKRAKKRAKNVKNGQKRAKYWKIWATMYKIWKYFENIFLVQTPLGTRPGLGTQPHYEAPGDLQVEIAKTQWLTSGWWGCQNGPKPAVGQSNSS